MMAAAAAVIGHFTDVRTWEFRTSSSSQEVLA
jgi:hypothetical protein